MSGVTLSGDFKLANSAGASHCCLILPLTISMVGVGAGVGVGVGGGVAKSLAPCVPTTVIILPLFKCCMLGAGSGVAPGAGDAPSAGVAAPVAAVGMMPGCGRLGIGAAVGLPTGSVWAGVGEVAGAFGLACATSVTVPCLHEVVKTTERARTHPAALTARAQSVR